MATLPGIFTVALEGSRATGEYRSDSDFDFAIYYPRTFEPNDICQLGWSGSVFKIGDWGGDCHSILQVSRLM